MTDTIWYLNALSLEQLFVVGLWNLWLLLFFWRFTVSDMWTRWVSLDTSLQMWWMRHTFLLWMWLKVLQRWVYVLPSLLKSDIYTLFFWSKNCRATLIDLDLNFCLFLGNGFLLWLIIERPLIFHIWFSELNLAFKKQKRGSQSC